MKRRRKTLIFLMTFLFFVGLGTYLYPTIRGAEIEHTMQQQVQVFFKQIDSAPVVSPSAAAETSLHHKELWDAMVTYNTQLWNEKQIGLCDPWSYEQPSFTLGTYGLADEVFGVISIPALNLELPLYLGADYNHLATGAAHLSQTSLPIGGNNTNCVIAGHCGWSGADFFRYITKLVPCDEVIITNPWETLTYTVTSTQIVLPHEVDQVLIQEGRDMLTLLTCHPYASDGTYRYLVFCDRVKP